MVTLQVQHPRQQGLPHLGERKRESPRTPDRLEIIQNCLPNSQPNFTVQGPPQSPRPRQSSWPCWCMLRCMFSHVTSKWLEFIRHAWIFHRTDKPSKLVISSSKSFLGHSSDHVFLLQSPDHSGHNLPGTHLDNPGPNLGVELKAACDSDHQSQQHELAPKGLNRKNPQSPWTSSAPSHVDSGWFFGLRLTPLQSYAGFKTLWIKTQTPLDHGAHFCRSCWPSGCAQMPSIKVPTL